MFACAQGSPPGGTNDSFMMGARNVNVSRSGASNVVIAVAGGILFYSSAFNHGFMAWHEYQGRTSSHPSLRSMLRFYFGARAVAGCVCAIGSLIYGGAMGLLGAFLSAWWSLFHFWVLKRVTREAADRPQQA